MAKIYFIGGFVGSGKTTHARQIEAAQGAFRFSIDEWMIPLYGEHMERALFDQRHIALQGLFKSAAIRLLAIEVPVVFDFGFWTRAQREDYAQWATKRGLDYELIFHQLDFEECSRRALTRNDQTSYTMTPEMLSLFWSWYEPPEDDEPITRLGCAG